MEISPTADKSGSWVGFEVGGICNQLHIICKLSAQTCLEGTKTAMERWVKKAVPIVGRLSGRPGFRTRVIFPELIRFAYIALPFSRGGINANDGSFEHGRSYPVGAKE